MARRRSMRLRRDRLRCEREEGLDSTIAEVWAFAGRSAHAVACAQTALETTRLAEAEREGEE